MNLPKVDPRTDRRMAAARRLRDLLRADIVDEVVAGGLPAEAELMITFAVSRQVVRDALAMLVDEGLITRNQGTGTHVVVSKVRHALNHLHGARTHRVRHQLLSITRMSAPPRVAARLQLANGSRCAVVEYLTWLENEPYYLGTVYVAETLVPILQRAEQVSEWYALYEDAGIVLGTNDQFFEATSADDHAAGLLEVAPGAPVLLVERLIRDRTGAPLEYAFARVRGDRLVLRTQLPRIPARRPADAEGEH